ncbi:hypothetical protein BGX28_004291 [Mortierella sp. GBA30]|nr:hypothetical protein BGX28_004291 [Mortierella sp. GBA30]
MQPKKDLMLSRRQKTLSSISNYIPIHVLLNQPAGVSFSLTIPKSITIEQLARQIEAEYAYLVEREVGNSSYPVIECGALFDHVDLPRRSRRRLSPRQRLQPKKQQPKAKGMSASSLEDGSEEVVLGEDGVEVQEEGQKRDREDEADGDEVDIEESDDDPDEADIDDDSEDQGDEDGDEDMIDEIEEAESRGVQLRFSDKVEDVLERDSTVHVVNIDQGLGMGRKLSLTNLALAVNDEAESFSDEPCTGQVPGSPSLHASAQATAPSCSPSIDAGQPAAEPSIRTTTTEGKDERDPDSPLSESASPHACPNSLAVESKKFTAREAQDPRASTLTTDTTVTLLELSSVPSSSQFHDENEAILTEHSALLTHEECGRPLSMCSDATVATTFSRKVSFQSPGQQDLLEASKRASTVAHTRPRSRATDILLNLESSSNDARFQEILHNTIALDHFRQFCFQEYSIENLLFWLDVELFAKPSLDLLERDQNLKKKESQSEEDDHEKAEEEELQDEAEMGTGGQFAVQHARYIYLTYIDPCGPLQVNLSDESRTDIPWPILDHKSHQRRHQNLVSSLASLDSSAAGSPMDEKEIGDFQAMDKKDEQPVGWPLDRHMFDGAQEHTYQLMKGHTLVRFEDSELWKDVEKIIRERPEEYANATIKGPINSYYRPDPSVILSTVARSRSRHPQAEPKTLYNWNNSTSDLDRSKDKEEALAKTMSQYFGPIPSSILGVGGQCHENDEEHEDYEGFGTCDDNQTIPTARNGRRKNEDSSKRLSTSSNSSSLASGFRNNRFTKRLVGRSGGTGSKIRYSIASVSEDLLDLFGEDPHPTQDPSLEIDSVENGRRTTRWMVAGYFDDQVRLTAAQRKRLLRRNNKLTKFFGSRVDGSLRPVDDNEERGFLGDYRFGAVGSSSVLSLGSPVAYALSSSTVQEKGQKKTKAFNKIHRNKLGRRMIGNVSESEVRLLLPGTSHGTSSDVYSKASVFKSGNLLQKFKKSSSDYEDDARVQNGYRSFGSSSIKKNFHPLEGNRASTLTSSIFASRKRDSSSGSGGSGHHRSLTAIDMQLQPARMLAAHPHPLWSGSLSDQEGSSSTILDRRRDLTLLSITPNSNNTCGHTAGVTPTTPTMTGLPAMMKGTDFDAGQLSPSSTQLTFGGIGPNDIRASMDRQAMYTRRKKADKLSTFFGAQLTPSELSSQLAMGQEDDLDQQQHDGNNGSLNESSKTQLQRVTGPTVSSVNKLSNKDRSILWKRSRKLRGILGESLPESEVALALTRPMLLGSFSTNLRGVRGRNGSIVGSNINSARRPSTAGKVSRKKRQVSLHGKGEEYENDAGEDEKDDEDDVLSGDYEDDVDSDAEDLTSSPTNGLLRLGVHSKGKGRVVKRSTSAQFRPRRPSTASALSMCRSYPQNPRSARGSVSDAGRRLSTKNSLESLQTINSLVSDLYDDGDDGGDEPVSSSTMRRRKSNARSLAGISHGVGQGVPGPKPSSFASNNNSDVGSIDAMSRFRRKKKMDKIQQFLGDRVPEQDLWIGAVGRERTREMMDMNILSPTSSSFSLENTKIGTNRKKSSLDAGTSTGSGGVVRAVSTSVSFSRHGKGFPRRSKSKMEDNAVEVMTSKRATATPGVRMERSLSDPMTGVFHGSALNGHPRAEGQKQKQPSPHRLSTISRLRQQLASPHKSPSSAQSSISCIGQPLLGSTTSSSSSPTTAGPASPDTANDAFLDEKGGHLEDEDDNSSTHRMIPRLRAMSGDDQERFLKRAEKLEKYFGHIPPSKLLESSLTTLSSSDVNDAARSGTPSATENATAKNTGGNVSGAQDRKQQHSKQRSLFELVGLLTNGKDYHGGSGSKDKDKNKKSASNPGSRRSSTQSLVKSAKASSTKAATSSSEVSVEALNVSDTFVPR